MTPAIHHSRQLRRYFFLIAFVVLLLDQATKVIVARNIPLNESVTVIPKFFSVSHVLNPGAAFSLFADNASEWTTAGLIMFSVVVLGVIGVILWNAREWSATSIGLSLIVGGALGNLVDRIATGNVVDFLAFYFGSYHWPDFNLADSAIVLGSILLARDIFFGRNAPVANDAAAPESDQGRS